MGLGHLNFTQISNPLGNQTHYIEPSPSTTGKLFFFLNLSQLWFQNLNADIQNIYFNAS